MIILITGGSGSGKSAYAEKRIMEFNSDKKYYLATMQVFGEEGKAKVLRHRKLRKDKGFETIECQRDVHKASELTNKIKSLAGIEEEKSDIKESGNKEPSSLLLECISNLVANEMFLQDGQIMPSEYVAKKVINDVKILSESLDNLVIVTNEVFSDGVDYDETSKNYMKALASVNKALGFISDEVVEVVVGIPVIIKKEVVLSD